ncbi:hypothetical protein [Leptolyngbya sp. Heron Island J]|uniref:hypothetical protein n=1 Tax=Leptolyngbya sp. Heron Island J TaxID=1385935 RepID=UPI00041F51D9|nr:hypothetical protein [Leptolyngbya sp. Heron Island J]
MCKSLWLRSLLMAILVGGLFSIRSVYGTGTGCLQAASCSMSILRAAASCSADDLGMTLDNCTDDFVLPTS